MSRKPKKSDENAPLSKAELEALVEEATVDAHDEEEQRSGFLMMIQDNLEVPFEIEVLGVTAVVEGVDMTSGGEIVAICARGKKRQRIPVVDLELPSPAPKGSEWIAAYRYWRGDDGSGASDE